MLTPLFTWSAVHATLAAITLFVSLVGGALFWVFHRIHERLNDLEEAEQERETAVFGNDQNPLHVGLTKEVAELKKEVKSIQEEMDNSSVEREDLKQRMVEVEQKIERILNQMDRLEDDD